MHFFQSWDWNVLEVGLFSMPFYISRLLIVSCLDHLLPSPPWQNLLLATWRRLNRGVHSEVLLTEKQAAFYEEQCSSSAWSVTVEAWHQGSHGGDILGQSFPSTLQTACPTPLRTADPRIAWEKTFSQSHSWTLILFGQHSWRWLIGCIPQSTECLVAFLSLEDDIREDNHQTLGTCLEPCHLAWTTAFLCTSALPSITWGSCSNADLESVDLGWSLSSAAVITSQVMSMMLAHRPTLEYGCAWEQTASLQSRS